MTEKNASRASALWMELQECLKTGTTLGSTLEAELINEQSALISRSVEALESVLSDKSQLLEALNNTELKISSIFDALGHLLGIPSQSIPGYIENHFPSIFSELKQFVEQIVACRTRGMENDGLLNVQLLQINSIISMISPQNPHNSKPVYSVGKSKMVSLNSTSSWVA